MVERTLNEISEKKLDDLPLCYVFITDDQYYIKKIINYLKKKLQDLGADSFDFWDADAKEDPLLGVLNNAYSLPFISSKKIVTYKNIEKLTDEESEGFKKYVASKNTTSCLCLFASKKSVIKGIKNKGIEVVELKTKGSIDGVWIRDFFKKYEKKISPQALEILKLALPKDNMFACSNELEKLLLYVGKNNVVSEADVRENIKEVNLFSIFNLIDDISFGKNKDAICKLNEILHSGTSAQEILAMLFWNFKRLWIACVMKEKGIDLPRILDKVNVKAWSKNKFLSQLNRYSKKQLSRIFTELAELEQSLKLKSSPSNVLLEMFILKVGCK